MPLLIFQAPLQEELSAKLLEFLESPHATTDILLADKEQVINHFSFLILYVVLGCMAIFMRWSC